MRPSKRTQELRPRHPPQLYRRARRLIHRKSFVKPVVISIQRHAVRNPEMKSLVRQRISQLRQPDDPRRRPSHQQRHVAASCLGAPSIGCGAAGRERGQHQCHLLAGQRSDSLVKLDNFQQSVHRFLLGK